MLWVGVMIGGAAGFAVAVVLCKLADRLVKLMDRAVTFMQAEREIVADTLQIAKEERIIAIARQSDVKSMCRN